MGGKIQSESTSGLVPTSQRGASALFTINRHCRWRDRDAYVTAIYQYLKAIPCIFCARFAGFADSVIDTRPRNGVSDHCSIISDRGGLSSGAVW